MPSPPYPWEKGQHKDYTAFVVEVEIAVDRFNVPWSNHRLQDQVDHDLTSQMKSGGMEYVAHALVSEAVKREAILEILIKMSNDAEFQGRVLDDAPEAQEILVKEMAAAIIEVFRRAAGELAPEAARAALDMVRSDPPDG